MLIMPRKYRDSISVVGDLLSIICEAGSDGVMVTELVRHANIPYKRCQKYLDYLNEACLIDLDLDKRNVPKGHARDFRITPKGIAYLNEFKEFRDTAKSYGIEL